MRGKLAPCFVKYSKSQLNLIYDKKPKLIKKPAPTLNDEIVAFLKKYEVFVTPPKSNGAITGAFTVIAGADVGGDTAMIQGQNKQNSLQEWISWKQWELDHKDFPKFQSDFFNEVNEYNKNIDKKLEDPEVQKVIDKLFSADVKRITVGRVILLILVSSIVGGLVFCFYF